MSISEPSPNPLRRVFYFLSSAPRAENVTLAAARRLPVNAGGFSLKNKQFFQFLPRLAAGVLVAPVLTDGVQYLRRDPLSEPMWARAALDGVTAAKNRARARRRALT
ncbi:hypothetical protein, partial [Paraburkholderia oxyphila]|uniref:hypothetical protein n=1 Tax=Paraburkholderia oxyphila TaxID=614212 RepID=UPI001C3F1F7A